MSDTFAHPTLGMLQPDDTDWMTNSVDVPFSNEPIGVCLADGTDDGPSQAAMDGYDWIAANWAAVTEMMTDEAHEFYEPYADAVPSVPKFAARADIWNTVDLQGVRIFSKDDFEVSARFNWQEEEDPHVVTFEMLNGGCVTHCVDG